VNRCALPCVVACLLLAQHANAQGDLRRVQSKIHPGPKYFAPEAARRGSNGSWFGMDPGINEAGGASLGPALIGLGVIAVGAATSPFWLPHTVFDPGFDQRGWFPAHPHMMSDRPYLLIGDCPEEPWTVDNYFDPEFIKPWALRFSAETGSDFDAMDRFSGQFFVDTSIHRLGFLMNWTYYRERAAGETDEAFMADYNLTWRITQSQRLMMHVGAGLRTWTYDDHTDPGVNFLYRADVFPISQVHCATIFEIGNLRDAFVMHLQAQAGFTFSHGELFAGYDWLRIGNVDLHGPMAGIRLWF
jgi:hypothetical protein